MQDFPDRFCQFAHHNRLHQEGANAHSPGPFFIHEFAESGIQDDGDIFPDFHGFSGQRFACLDLYVLDFPAGSDDVKEVKKLEGLGQRTKFGLIKRLSESPATVGGRSMTRRISHWDAKERQAKLISVRCVSGGRLYVLIGLTKVEDFDALVPELTEAIESLRVW